MKPRIISLFIAFSLVWILLLGRAAFLQFLPDEKLNLLQKRQFQTTVTLPARRGAILDRSGRDLAMSVAAYSLYADPKIIEAKRKTARALAKHLPISYSHILSKISDSDRRFVWLYRQMNQATAEKIKALNIRGLSFIEEWKRVYPNESLLAPVLGFVGSEGQGLEGLELQFNDLLKGNQKKMVVRKDARGRPLMADGMIFTENPDGHEIRLTLDSELQYVLESELQTALQEFEANSAVGIILDAQSSAIRAMATVPTFDANRALQATHDHRRNKVVTDTFEPGSTLKSFVVAAALRDKKIQPNTKFFCEDGSYKIGDRIIREADRNHKFGWLTVSEILAFSSNIGTAKIAIDMGSNRVRSILSEFGFGAKTGVDLPGEAKGTLLPLPWNTHLLSNVSFGQGVAVTPLQMANAYAAIANGGILKTPYILQSVKDAETGEVQETKSAEGKRILSIEEASHMRYLLTSVTAPGGTGVNAKVNGFIVGGKTGTAQKVSTKGRGYIPGEYISSFAGFIPAHEPRFVIYIAVDQPRKAYYGSQVAAPIFSRVASYAARKEGLAPVLLSEKNLVPKSIEVEPSLPSLSKIQAQKVTEDINREKIETVPDLHALTLREILQRMQDKEVKLQIRGQGTVSDIIPSPGEPLPADKTIQIMLR